MQVLDILAVGESMVELNDVGDNLASWTYAGDALNWAVAVARALPSARVRHLSALGDDERSAGFVAFCADRRVDVTASPVVPGRAMGLYWISTVDGDRRFRYWRSESAARHHLRSGEHILPTDATDVVMFSNITLAVAGDQVNALFDELRARQSSGATLVYDTNFRASLWADMASARAADEAATDIADYVHASVDDIAAIWGESTDHYVAKLEGAGVAEVVVTDGAGDVTVHRNGVVDTFRPRTVEAVDTSGAGDAFYGTYVGRRLGGAAVADAVAAASDVCALVVAHRGALSYTTAGTSAMPDTPG